MSLLWYLKKEDGTIYGPKEERALQIWAMDGRVGPADLISIDQKEWNPAPSLPALEMEWLLPLDDQETYGPMNLLAMTEWLLDGTLGFDTPVRHAKTGEEALAGSRILTTLLSHLQQERERTNEALRDSLALSETLSSTPPAAPATDDKEPPLKEVQKWQGLYEDERRHRQESEAKLNEHVRTLRQELHETQSVKDKLAQKMRQMELDQQKMQAALDGQGLGDEVQGTVLMASHQQLSENYDAMLDQLTTKSEEIRTLIHSRDEAERNADLRVKQMEEMLHRERTEADAARHRLADIETAHLQLVRAFRDMNDRYIRMKQQLPTDARPTAAEPEPKPAPPGWKPKVRLS